MTKDEECKHLVYPASACTICNGKDAKQEATGQYTGTFDASYGGRCQNCPARVSEGDVIRIDRATGKVIHAGCEK
jgi:hypothetical protein